MMKTFIPMITALLIPCMMPAAIWTVDNNTAHPANFRTIQDAIDAAAVGDTILVAGSAVVYSSFTSTKRLNIKGEMPSAMGPGTIIYGHSQGNCKLREVFDLNSPNHLRNAGGSHLEGITFQDGITIDGPCSGVTIKRCDFLGNGDITLSGCSGTLIVNCRVDVIGIHSGSVNGRSFTGSENSVIGTWAYQLYPTQPTNTLVENSVFGYYTMESSQSDPLRADSAGYPPFTVRNSIIIAKGDIAEDISRGVFDHCLLIGSSTLPAGNGNLSLPYSDFSNVFVDATSYLSTSRPPAEVFVLKAGSPAIGAGVGGVDMGMYGGLAPYVPGQIPALPRISRLVVPPIVPNASGLTFEVEAQARD